MNINNLKDLKVSILRQKFIMNTWISYSKCKIKILFPPFSTQMLIRFIRELQSPKFFEDIQF